MRHRQGSGITKGKQIMAEADKTGQAKLPVPAKVDMKPSSYQPSRAELEEEIDMPGWSLGQVREVFMRPFVGRDS